LSKNGEQRRGRQAADESPIQVHRHPGVCGRIGQTLGFDASFITTFSGPRERMLGTDNSRPERNSIYPFVRYALPLAAAVGVLLACHAFPGLLANTTMYILLFLVIAYSAWCCGIRPSILSLALAIVGAKYWFIPPIRSFRVPDLAQSISVLAFIFASTAVVIMGEARRRHNQQLQDGQAELEVRVKQRTVELDTANKGLRQLSARLLQLQDDERRRLARELHDSVGQLLAGLTMNLSAARADIDRLSKTAASLVDSEALVQEMGKEVRTISYLLHPPLLDEAGLSSAVRWYIEGFAQRSKIKVDLDVPDDFGRLSPELETAIFRVVQECLTNIHRHSGSSIAKIRLLHVDGQVLVEVEDKGRGISPAKREEMVSAGVPGVGIRGMRERMRQLGGDLEIVSDGNGTAILARLPAIENCSTAEVSPLPDASTAAA
jgi:signal transduction histidine kinase